jgi:hypothetical protein
VPAVLAVFNWPKGSDRYRRVERFVERLFAKWDSFQVTPRHPKWRDVNLAATVPGWTRWSVAEQIFERMRGSEQALSRDFQSFLGKGGTNTPQSEADRDVLFRQFLQWREQQRERRP